jgi:histidinol-phosphate/aromatic aminotransferase/cobyric acid decarboxylase-like protein
VIRPSDLLGPPARPALEGLSAAVYGLVLPETRAMVRRLWEEQPHVLFEQAYEDSQDATHLAFLRAWRDWVAPVVAGADGFPHQYVTNGSSEAIRESVWSLAKAARDAGARAQMHVFAGEYEGSGAYARAAGVDVLSHDRATWQEIAFAPGVTHRWYVSQPSATDGNVWPDFADFVREMQNRGIEVAVDLAYVGAVAEQPVVDLGLPNVQHVFFSLSKVFGVFYHRVGGMLSRTPMLGLEGNKWFKNMFSLYLGTSLIRETPDPRTLPARYRHVQHEACRIVAERHGIPLTASDVIVLASSPPGPYPDAFRRGGRYRWCLTPTMDRLLRATTREVADA